MASTSDSQVPDADGEGIARFDDRLKAFEAAPSQESRRVVNVLRTLHLCGLVFAIACIFVSYLLAHRGLTAAQPWAEIVNVAGRQRMLSQRISSSSLEVADASRRRNLLDYQAATTRLATALGDFNSACEWLAERDAFDSDSVNIVPALRQDVSAEALRHQEADPFNTGFQSATSRRVGIAADAFLPRMEQVVKLAEASAEDVVAQGQRQAMFAAGGAAAVLLIQGLVTFKPAQRRVREALATHEAANAAAREWAVSEQTMRRGVEAVRESLETALAEREAAEILAAREDRLRRQFQLRYELAVKGTADGIWDWDLENDTLWYSEAFNQQLGYEDDPLEPSLETFRDRLCHPDDVDRVLEAVQRHLDDGTTFDEMVRLRHKDGSWRRIRTRGSAARDEDGQPIRFAGAHQDLTDLLDQEERLRKLAEQASEAKSRLIADVSHEIRTPMTAILAYAENIGDEHTDAAKVGDMARAIRRNGGHLLALLDEVLDDAKLNAGQLGTRIRPTVVRDLCDDVISAFQGRADAASLYLKVDIATSLPAVVSTDEMRLRQILSNLVGNALKFTSTGGVTVQLRGEDNDLVASVTDTGIGIEADQVAKLFRRFEQADDGTGSTANRFGGTGLGLSISKRLAELLGGDISITSTPGEGSTFTLRIPAPACDEATQQPTPKPASIDGAHVLVVEDNLELQRLVVNKLERAGAITATAGDGEAAQRAVDEAIKSRKAFDIVLLDFNLPQMTGFEIAAKLTEQLGHDRPKLVLCSAAADQVSEAAVGRLFDAALCKPTPTQVMLSTLSELYCGDGEAFAAGSEWYQHDDLEEAEAFAALQQAFSDACEAHRHTLLDAADLPSADRLKAARSVAHQLRAAASFGYPDVGPVADAAESALDEQLNGGKSSIEALRALVEALPVSSETRRAAA